MHQTGANEGNNYSTLVQSSRNLLDFRTGNGLSIAVGKTATECFQNAAILNAFQGSASPFLSGSISYLHHVPALSLHHSRNARLSKHVEHFAVPPLPVSPPDKPLVMYRGQPFRERDYLMFGSLYLPEPRLDALWASRLDKHWLALASVISTLPQKPKGHNAQSDSDFENAARALPLVSLSLQHDNDRWATDYSYSFPDHLMGFRVLHNFGVRPGGAINREEDSGITPPPYLENDAADSGAGLKGRFSAGAEVYFSAVTKSAGLSTGIRFATIPESRSATTDASLFSQPPTTLTATLNPIMGHISTAVASQIGRDLAVATRYDFNFHSFLSELTMGLEWWKRREHPSPKRLEDLDQQPDASFPDSSGYARSFWRAVKQQGDGERTSVFKASMSASRGVSLLWEARLAGCLVGLGLQADLNNLSSPVKSFGLSLQYLA